ncbi:MAG: thermonuclease family protein [Candidatus Pacebacteria bacterium]|nr:thermonuclease family protein [Candidatus Paceibacterota bacterium]MCD8508402.1 thermonuclease family protein [Candidatus Paceibacterota bacterium]MCD8527923.1 thermonuclease family protein [Candidatus Paceibacterota bacterium]MCD8563717.1 thermonuclease family protein [Candidatus Paceibacterota bacterium]
MHNKDRSVNIEKRRQGTLYMLGIGLLFIITAGVLLFVRDYTATRYPEVDNILIATDENDNGGEEGVVRDVSDNTDTGPIQNIDREISLAEILLEHAGSVDSIFEPTHRIVRIVDGDTMVVRTSAGREERIRVIGIDTPETVHPNRDIACFGIEATAFARTLFTNQDIIITTDPTQGDRDRYGRMLGYITLPDGRDFGHTMIHQGYAFEYTFRIPYQKQSLYKDAERDARMHKRGMWADDACPAYE